MEKKRYSEKSFYILLLVITKILKYIILYNLRYASIINYWIRSVTPALLNINKCNNVGDDLYKRFSMDNHVRNLSMEAL